MHRIPSLKYQALCSVFAKFTPFFFLKDAEGFLGQIGAVDIFGIAFAFDETFLSS
jgi:hypothetical protein